MWTTEGVPGRNPNPRPNLFVYPHEKASLDYDDFYAMPGSRHEEEEDGLLGRIFSQHQLVTEGSGGEHGEAAEDEYMLNEGKRAEEKRGRMMRKRPSGKTDRHSKILTAQGLRDRRIRLSVHVSRKFFDLQDMLGFDKASNTIEWLISKSRGAIKGLSLRRGDVSSKGVPEISKCDSSKIKECGPSEGKAVAGIQKAKSCAESSRGNAKRDLRERARVRQRERTIEKTMMKISESSSHDEKLTDCSNFNASDGHRDFGSIEIIEKFLGNMNASDSSLHTDPTGNYYSKNANYSDDDRFQDANPGSRNASHLGGYHQ